MHALSPTLKMIDRCVVRPLYGIGLKVLLTIFLMWDSERLDETGWENRGAQRVIKI